MIASCPLCGNSAGVFRRADAGLVCDDCRAGLMTMIHEAPKPRSWWARLFGAFWWTPPVGAAVGMALYFWVWEGALWSGALSALSAWLIYEFARAAEAAG